MHFKLKKSVSTYIMINRELLRCKVLQTLYAYYKGNTVTHQMAEKELFHNLERTYDLYFHLLQLIIDITNFAALRIETKRGKLQPHYDDLNPNLRFVDNRFVKQLTTNTTLRKYLTARKLSWVNHPELIKHLFEQISESTFYNEYMLADTSSYEADKDLWRKIFKKIMLENEMLDSTVEEDSIFWVDDLVIVISFVLKSIKRFEEENEASQPLLPMFKSDDDAAFARELLQVTLKRETEYRELIDKHTQNWDLDRIAFMDILIMQVALAEITTFPSIPVNVSLNEYIEIAKKYSTVKSGTFINGVLDKIVTEMKTEKTLIKIKSFTNIK